MLEKLLKDYLRIEDRKNEHGKVEKIDLNKLQDLAFIKSQFKRELKKVGPKNIIMINNYYERTILDLSCSCLEPLRVVSLEDRNKILTIINNWIEAEKTAGKEPLKIELI